MKISTQKFTQLLVAGALLTFIVAGVAFGTHPTVKGTSIFAPDINADGGTFATLFSNDIKVDGGTFATLFSNDIKADGGTFSNIAIPQAGNLTMGTATFSNDGTSNVSSVTLRADNGFRGASAGQGVTFSGGLTLVACTANNSVRLRDTGGNDFMLASANGIQPLTGSLGTCGTVGEGFIMRDNTAGGTNTFHPTRTCQCTFPGDGGTNFWRNIVTGNAGTTTTCVD